VVASEVELADQPLAIARIANRVEDRSKGNIGSSGNHLGDEALGEGAPKREVDVGRAPSVEVVAPGNRHRGATGDEPIAALGVGHAAPDAGEVGSSGPGGVDLVPVATGCVGLPDLDQGVA